MTRRRLHPYLYNQPGYEQVEYRRSPKDCIPLKKRAAEDDAQMSQNPKACAGPPDRRATQCDVTLTIGY